jgi:AAA+ superfamily predicted ATPase
MGASNDLKLLVLSGNPLISIETTDESRAVDRVRQLSIGLARQCWDWSVTTGLRPLQPEGSMGSPVVAAGNPKEALKHLLQSPTEAVYLFRDLGPHCRDPIVVRQLRDLSTLLAARRGVLILLEAMPLADEVRRLTVRFEIGWPDSAELEQVVRDTYARIRRESMHDVTATITRRDMEQLVQMLRGLSRNEAERVVASAIHDDYQLTPEDLALVVEAKRTLLGSKGCLETIVADFSPDDIGGLDNLKCWLRQRHGGFSKRAAKFGLEPPRGMLMLGVPGCGKSLCAKVVAADWQMPLLRLDPGVLYQKFVGESESQLRQALAQAEAMAPVVLWIDEIEKAFASAAAASADGGLSKRMFGTLLSWMQDHRHPIFIVATANDIAALPPELMRKGRFDEIFFVDLPKPAARAQILAIHLRRRDREPASFDLARLAEAADGFSGSELEQSVVAALYAAFSEDCELQDRHLLDELGKTRPLSSLMQERVRELRAWADGRCVFAD